MNFYPLFTRSIEVAKVRIVWRKMGELANTFRWHFGKTSDLIIYALLSLMKDVEVG
jgi:hypothetical protein